MAAEPDATMPDEFPYLFTPEVGVPRWQRYRFEGRSLRNGLLNAPWYFAKLAYKKRTAPPEEVRYFDRQRQILRHLWQNPAAAGDTRLALVGDIMWLRDGWGSFLDPGVRDYLNAHDALVGNLESVISPRFKVKSFWPDYYTLNSHPNLIRTFRRADGRSTFSALSVANNHTFDYGDQGARDTHEFLTAEGIPHSGVRFRPADKPYVTFRANGITFGFYAATYAMNPTSYPRSPEVRLNELSPGVNDAGAPIDVTDVRRALADMAADGVDFRVVALHWGHEFEYYPCPRHVQFAREIVRAGADVILGTHPHVQQPFEVLFLNGYEERYPEWHRALAVDCGAALRADGPPRKALVAYSLGNFATTLWTFACRVGWVLSLRLSRDAGTRRVDWSPDASAFVVNVPRMPPTRERKLLLFADYLQRMRECKRLSLCYEQEYVDFLQQHLWGTKTAETPLITGSRRPDEAAR